LGVKARILPESGVPERYRRKEIAKVYFSRTHQKEMANGNFYYGPSKANGKK
jgi:hypothetical protein